MPDNDEIINLKPKISQVHIITIIIQSILGAILILQGLFLWFALAFNGSVGEELVNFSFFISAMLMIICGGLKISGTKRTITNHFCLASIVFYLPMIWQRFDSCYGIDSAGFSFDIWIIIIMFISLGCDRQSAPISI